VSVGGERAGVRGGGGKAQLREKQERGGGVKEGGKGKDSRGPGIGGGERGRWSRGAAREASGGTKHVCNSRKVC